MCLVPISSVLPSLVTCSPFKLIFCFFAGRFRSEYPLANIRWIIVLTFAQVNAFYRRLYCYRRWLWRNHIYVYTTHMMSFIINYTHTKRVHETLSYKHVILINVRIHSKDYCLYRSRDEVILTYALWTGSIMMLNRIRWR